MTDQECFEAMHKGTDAVKQLIAQAIAAERDCVDALQRRIAALEESLRRRTFMARRIAKEFVAGGPGSDFIRVSGDAECSRCGLKYYDHPVCDDQILHVGCDGTLLKL